MIDDTDDRNLITPDHDQLYPNRSLLFTFAVIKHNFFFLRSPQYVEAKRLKVCQ